jgi:hypothetical protein
MVLNGEAINIVLNGEAINMVLNAICSEQFTASEILVTCLLLLLLHFIYFNNL